MPQSLAQVYLHLVWSTKNRIPFLRDAQIREEMHSYLAGACKNLDCLPIAVGGVEDHVHIACCLSRRIAIADLVRLLKKESSKWVKGKDSFLESFYWQEGYGAFSISPGHLGRLRRYVANQEEHHRTVDFQGEFLGFLEKYGVDFDERYLWD